MHHITAVADKIQPGTYWEFEGHRIHGYLTGQWWKVIAREGDFVRLRSKSRDTRTIVLLTARHLMARQWMPDSV